MKVMKEREKMKFVEPQSMNFEKKLNIFLQADNNQISEALGLIEKSPENVFTHIRNLKDNF